MEEQRGWRAVPPALLLGLGAWMVLALVRLVHVVASSDVYAVRLNLVAEGTMFAGYLLAALGTYDLSRRLVGREALGLKIAALGFATLFAVDVSYTFTSFVERLYDHRWIFDVFNYAYFVPALAVMVGLAVALWQVHKGFAVVLLVIAVATHPPQFLQEPLYGWLDLGGHREFWLFDLCVRFVRLAAILWAVLAIARGTTQPHRVLAADGMRSAAKALWLRLIAAVSVGLLTLIVLAGKGGQGSLEVLKLAMVSAAVLNIIALAMFGLGAVRGARAEVGELPRWLLLVGGGTALWGAGVTLAQLPWLYRSLYKGDSMGGPFEEYAQVLSIALPVVVTAGVAIVAFAIGSYGNRSGNSELAAQAQSKGAGFVALTLVAIAIQIWMLPKASSLSSFVMLSLLAAVAAFVGSAMMATLCSRTAAVLEGEPSLPTAKVVDP